MLQHAISVHFSRGPWPRVLRWVETRCCTITEPKWWPNWQIVIASGILVASTWKTGSTSQSIATEQGDAGVGIPSVQIAGDGNGDVKIGFSQIPTLPLQDGRTAVWHVWHFKVGPLEEFSDLDFFSLKSEETKICHHKPFISVWPK